MTSDFEFCLKKDVTLNLTWVPELHAVVVDREAGGSEISGTFQLSRSFRNSLIGPGIIILVMLGVAVHNGFHMTNALAFLGLMAILFTIFAFGLRVSRKFQQQTIEFLKKTLS